MEHRPSTIPLQRTRFWAASHAPFQLSFWALSSASVSRLQLLQGRPLLRFPWGFQLRACLVMLAGGFLSVWPIQPHFLWRICLASGSCPARSHKSVLLILSGHRMPRIRRRQVLTKHCIFWVVPLCLSKTASVFCSFSCCPHLFFLFTMFFAKWVTYYMYSLRSGNTKICEERLIT